MTVNEMLEYITERNEEALYPTGYEEAIIGMVEMFGRGPVILLDKAMVLEILGTDMNEEDALEFYYYNILGAWMGDGTPAYAEILHVKDHHDN